MNTNFSTKIIFTLPEVITSNAREITWALEYWQREYKTVCEQSATAWRLYNEVIDKNAPLAEVNEMWFIAKMFDELKTDTWHELDNAKANYLALMS